MLNAYQIKALKWLPQIREWIENAEMLARNGFTFDCAQTYWCCGSKHTNYLDAKNKVAVLNTDGVHHGFGFFPKSISIMGVAQGGCCGDWHIKTDVWYWWIQKGAEKRALRLEDYRDLLQKRKSENSEWDGMNKIEIFAHKMELFFKELEK